jgi:hypothetical protein
MLHPRNAAERHLPRRTLAVEREWKRAERPLLPLADPEAVERIDSVALRGFLRGREDALGYALACLEKERSGAEGHGSLGGEGSSRRHGAVGVD